MGCGGSEEKQEGVVATQEEGEVEVVDEDPPEGWVQVEVLCEKHALKMYVGPSHTVKDLLNYVNSILTETTTFEGDCVCSGLTSTWALADGGLVFCEDDNIIELDGWDENKDNAVFVALTENAPVESWTEEGAIDNTRADEGFTEMTLNDYKWGSGEPTE